MQVERVDAASDEAVRLVDAYVAELAETFPGGFDPAVSSTADVEELRPPRGSFLVLRDDDGAATGCGAVRLLSADVAEIKRMYVVPAARGRGLGRVLLDALEAAAREIGATTAVLDTNETLTSALQLYLRSGWREVPAYNDNAYATHWFDKQL